jgi:predicted ester cyclase
MATESMVRHMTTEETRAVMDRYLSGEHAIDGVLADDVVFTVMATGQAFQGPDAVCGMLTYFYHGVFEAVAEQRDLIIGEGRAMGEWDFVGTHVGEFAGVQATGLQVRVPLAVAYDLEGGRITRGRVYFEIPSFLAQVGGAG